MDIKSIIVIEIKKEERTYRFEMPTGASYGECYDAAFQTLTKVAEMANDAVTNMKKQEAEAPATAVEAEVTN